MPELSLADIDPRAVTAAFLVFSTPCPGFFFSP